MSALSDDDRTRLAELHARSIDQGFLASLGTPVLARIYDTFVAHRSTHLYVARDDQAKVVGLAVASHDLRSLYGHFLLRSGPRVLLAIIRQLVRWRSIVAVAETLVYPLRRSVELEPRSPDLELLNLCVDEGLRGQGVARRLMDRTIADFRDEGGGCLRIVSGGHQQAAHSLYESLGACHVAEISVHRGVASRVFDLHVAG